MSTEICVGEKLAGHTVVVTRETLLRYAKASGDSNPIHRSDRAAKAIGLEGVLAHGMWTMGAVIGVVLDWLGCDANQLLSYRVRFAAPLYVPKDGAAIDVTAEVTEIADDVATIEINVTRYGVQILAGAKAEVSA